MMADYAANQTDKEIAKLGRKIAKLYREAQKDIEAKTKDFWERHEVKNVKYQEQLKEGKITEDDYQSWLRGQVFQGKQWTAKREQIEQILTDTNKQAINIINGGRIDVFATNSNWQAYRIEHEIGLNFGFGIYDADAVTRLLRDDPNLLPPKKLSVSKDKKWNKGNINRQISQGIIQGESLDKIAKRLQTVTTMNRNQSLTNARTMMTGAQNAGRQESMKRAQDMGIKVKKKWLATLDGHTRRSHRRLDGQTVDIDEPFKIGGYSIEYPGDSSARPEMVYNCRCTMTSEIEDFPNEGERYDNIAGKPIKNMTYMEWLEAKSRPEFTQVTIAACKTVNEVSKLMNDSGHFTTTSNLDGCDLDGAKAIASAYQQTVEKFPQLSGQIGGVKAKELKNRAYAQCFFATPERRVEVNTEYYKNWKEIVEKYEYDVYVGWHPANTTAESIVVHEIGHAIDGLITTKKDMWEWKKTKNGYDTKSFANEIRAKVCMSTGWKISQMGVLVSRYASQNAQEWFAECYAEYITSPYPSDIAKKFGEFLEKELENL